MADKLVKIAAYSFSVEAQVARGLLEAESIRTMLGGEQAANLLPGFPGQITLHVAESDAARATALLAEIEAGPPPDDSRLWLCPLCGDAVDIDVLTCPACETPRPETWQVRSAMASSPFPSDSENIQDKPPLDRPLVTSDVPIEAVPWAREEEETPPTQEPSILRGRRRHTFAVALVAVLIAVFAWWLVRLAGQVAASLLGWGR